MACGPQACGANVYTQRLFKRPRAARTSCENAREHVLNVIAADVRVKFKWRPRSKAGRFFHSRTPSTAADSGDRSGDLTLGTYCVSRVGPERTDLASTVSFNGFGSALLPGFFRDPSVRRRADVTRR